jgi:competence protein ComEC
MCGPLVVLIQPSFLTMSLAANIAVSPFVPLVTVAGTLALATCTWCPPIALVCTATGGAAAQAVATCARLLASLPGAALPWPDGPAGALAMAVMSTVNAAALCAGLSPAGRRAAARLVRGLTDGARAAAASASGLGRGARRGRVDR